jgi:hypothetical protein
MKWIHLLTYRFFNWAVVAFDPVADWLDKAIPIKTDAHGSSLWGAIGFRMIAWECLLYGRCIKEGTLHAK